MTAPDQRRSFASRTPENDHPDRVRYRRGFVTRHQVSGWRFLMRRMASGVALHDARMLVDPLRSQSRAVLTGALLTITGVIACLVFSWIRPSGVPGNDPVLADRSTSALYVRVDDRLYPVLNLTSARLIVGRPVNPKAVKSSALDRFPRGNLIGIPGAPERMVQNTSRDADWTVCDTVGGADAGVTVIAGEIVQGNGRAAELGARDGVLVADETGTFLLWNGRRSRIDLADRAVTAGLGFDATIPAPRHIDPGLFNAIPEAPALVAPAIPGAGNPTAYPLPVPAPIGAVLAAYTTTPSGEAGGAGLSYYAVLPDGLQPVPPVLASVLRNTDSYGLDQPPRLSPDAVARAPVSRMLDTGAFPAQPVTLLDEATSPVTCARWTQPAAANSGSLVLLAGSSLPLDDSVHTVGLVSGGTATTAARVAMTPGTGYFVHSVGTRSGGMSASEFWVSDTGVRYGIETEDSNGAGDKTVEALGLKLAPLPIPWAILSLFAQGPTLSRSDALLARDTLTPDPLPAHRVGAARESR